MDRVRVILPAGYASSCDYYTAVPRVRTSKAESVPARRCERARTRIGGGRSKRRGLENFSMKLGEELIQRRRLFTVSVFVDLQDYEL